MSAEAERGFYRYSKLVERQIHGLLSDPKPEPLTSSLLSQPVYEKGVSGAVERKTGFG